MGELAFTGAYPHTLDLKGRLTIPAQYRDRLVRQNQVYVSIGYMRILTIYPVDTWEARTRDLTLRKDDEGKRFEDRMFDFAAAYQVDVDPQGRLLISAELRKKTSLKREVVVAGNGDCVMVWDRDEWEQFEEGVLNRRKAGNQVP
jgi:MraZ protein